MKQAQESQRSYQAWVTFVRCINKGTPGRWPQKSLDYLSANPLPIGSAKLRGEGHVFLEAFCREVPCTPSSALQASLRERFAALHVSVSQINRVRATLGVSNPSRSSRQEKNGK